MVIGRMKFCRDIFRAVYKVDQELAVNAFQKEKDSFHPIARRLIEKVSFLGSSVQTSVDEPETGSKSFEMMEEIQ